MAKPTPDQLRATLNAEVGGLAQQITARIHEGMAAGLYPEGLTPNLYRALSVNQLVGQELAPAAQQEPVEPITPVEPVT